MAKKKTVEEVVVAAPVKTVKAKAAPKSASETVEKKVKAVKGITYDQVVTFVQKSIKPASVKKISETITAAVTVKGSGEGVFFIKLENGVAIVEKYDYKDNDLSIIVDSTVIENVKNKKETINDVISNGMIEVYGNVLKAVKFAEIF